jgi:hypothetical protein
MYVLFDVCIRVCAMLHYATYVHVLLRNASAAKYSPLKPY